MNTCGGAAGRMLLDRQQGLRGLPTKPVEAPAPRSAKLGLPHCRPSLPRAPVGPIGSQTSRLSPSGTKVDALVESLGASAVSPMSQGTGRQGSLMLSAVREALPSRLCSGAMGGIQSPIFGLLLLVVSLRSLDS